MATLTPLTVGNATTPSGWTSAPNGALGDNSDATYGYDSQNSTHSADQGWELGNVDADFSTMGTLSVVLRYAWQTGTQTNTWNSLSCRVMNGATVLAAADSGGTFQTVASSITTSTPTNSASTAFSYVNTAADKTAWDAAVVEIRITITKNKGGDTLQNRVYEADFTGTYTAAANVTVTPTTASLTTATFAPTVTATNNVTVVPTTASLSLSAFAPTVTASDHQTVTPTTASLSLATFAPTVTGGSGVTVTPSTAALTTATFAPTVLAPRTATPTTASLATAAFAPTVTASDNKVVTPSPAGAGGTIAQDSFTGPAGDLNTHTAETGGTWFESWSEPYDRWIRIDGAGRASLDLSATPPGDLELRDVAYALDSATLGDGYVQARLYSGGLGSSWLVARQDPTNADTFYFAKYLSGTLYLFRNTNYSYVQIASLGGTSGEYVRFRVAGSSPTTLQVERRTTLGALGTGWQINTSDNTAANQIASGWVGIAGEYDDDFVDWTGDIDDFLAVSEGSGLALTLYAPSVTVSANQTVTPGVVAPTTATFAPTVSTTAHQTVTPTTVALTLATFAPTVTGGAGVTVTPTTAALTIATFAPSVTVSDHQTVTPTTASLALSAFAPSVVLSDHQTVTPTTASLSLAAFAPTVTGGAGLTVTPDPASLSLTAFAPDVTATDHQVVTPSTAALTLAAFAPTVTGGAGVTVTPTTASLSLTAFAPTVSTTANVTVTPGPLALTLTGHAPVLSGIVSGSRGGRVGAPVQPPGPDADGAFLLVI